MTDRGWLCANCGSHKLSPGPYMNGKHWCYGCSRQVDVVPSGSRP